MCYDSTASIASFATGVLSSAVLYGYNPAMAVFFAWVIAMQLFDYIFWKNPEKNRVNFWTTKVATFFNLLQPIVLALCVILLESRSIHAATKLILAAYSISATAYLAWHWKAIDYTLADHPGYPGLFWKWNHLAGAEIVYTLFVLSLSMLAYLHFPKPINVVFLVLVLASWSASAIYVKGTAVGRFWCFFAGFIPLVLVFSYACLLHE